jgi:hypothetical protein
MGVGTTMCVFGGAARPNCVATLGQGGEPLQVNETGRTRAANEASARCSGHCLGLRAGCCLFCAAGAGFWEQFVLAGKGQIQLGRWRAPAMQQRVIEV